MRPDLLDANVAIALMFGDHEHHDRASTWLADTGCFALCPVVEGALARFVLRLGESGSMAAALLRGLRSHPGAEFWPDDVSYTEVALADLRGHRQVTDAYLATLARAHDARVVTFDTGLAALQPDVALLLS